MNALPAGPWTSKRKFRAPLAGPDVDHQFVIVGAGFGGMGAAIQLNRMGIDDILIIDRADDLGGTWHLNTYPGLAVDIASTTYSYSFEPNPYWTQLYAPGPELKSYANHVARKYDLNRYMRFNADVHQARYDEANKMWRMRVKGMKPFTARVLILATGFLSQPKRPDIPGLDSFAGKVIHTARWDHDYDLTGKRAAVIGTGATSVQLLPEIAPKLEHLDVYQRTPIWVAPKVNPEIPKAVRKLFARAPITQRLARYASSTVLEFAMVSSALHNKEFPGLAKSMERMCTRHLHRQVKDPVLRQKLTPTYTFGCKRPTFSNDYFKVFTRPNVDLVTDGIDRIEPDGIVDSNGRKRNIDTLILATGYKVWEKGNFPAFEVRGRDGVDMREFWDKNTYQSYEGISVAGFPNLFYLASPYGFTGLSYFFTIEGQMKHMERCLGELNRQKACEFEVKQTAQERFVKNMRSKMGSSVVFSGNCATSNSYYFNQHGDSTLLRPTPTPLALWSTSHFPLKDYRFSG